MGATPQDPSDTIKCKLVLRPWGPTQPEEDWHGKMLKKRLKCPVLYSALFVVDWWLEPATHSGIIQNNVALKKLFLLIDFMLLRHAAICMYIANIEMHKVERFLYSQTTILHISFSFFLTFILHITSPKPLKIFAILCDIFFPFVWKILTHSSLLLLSLFFFLPA